MNTTVVKKTILFICRHKEDLKLLNNIKTSDNCKIIVASDSILVQNKAKEYSQVSEVTFTEQMDSMFTVAEDVLKIREKVNSWLVKLNPNVPPYLLEWIKWAEGGDATQRIQDALLLINSYLYLIEKYNVNEIVLHRRIGLDWEDEILIETAKSKNIKVREYKNVFYAFGKILKLRRFSKKIGNQRVTSLIVPEFFLIKAKQIVIVYRILKHKLFNKKQIFPKDKKLIVFLLGSSADKHIDNISIVMKEFAKYEGYLPVTLCWNASLGCKKINNMGLQAYNLENWFPIKNTYDVLKNFFRTTSFIHKKVNNFVNQVLLKYNGVPLNKELIPFIRRFIKTSSLKRLFLYYSTKNFLSHNTPKAVCTWGENVLEFGLVFYKALNDIKDKKPIIFHYPVGITIENPYSDSYNAPDIIFVSGVIDKNIHNKYLNNSSDVIVSGYGKSTSIREFQNKYNLENSKKFLGIFNLLEYNIFYASNGILRGMISTKEHFSLVISLIEFILGHNNVSLIVKPHPDEDENLWYDILKKYNYPKNLLFFDKGTNPYHCINISDLIITKFSTLALEAMEFEKPVISVVLDGEKKYQNIFEDGVEKITDIDNLKKILVQLTANKEYFNEWKQQRIYAQNKFLPKKMFKSKVPPEKIIVDYVIDRMDIN